MVTIKQVSELAGVSLATVSRVINNTAQVKPSTKARVQKAMQQLGYRPNFIAQSLALNTSNTVGYVVPELHGAFFGAMLARAEYILRKASKHLFISVGHSKEQDEMNVIDSLRDRRCDALILHVEAVSDDYLIELAANNVTFLVVNRHIPAIAHRCIGVDNTRAAYIATETLIQKGHRDIAYITGQMWKADARDRLLGHRQALLAMDLQHNFEFVFKGDFQAQSGYQKTVEILRKHPKITAIVCANDEMAYGACNAIRDHKLRIPADISVMGFDNVEFSEFTFPRLTTVDYPSTELGEQAANWVLAEVYQQKKQYRLDMILPKVVLRDSIADRNLNN